MKVYQIEQLRLNDDKRIALETFLCESKAYSKIQAHHQKLREERESMPREEKVFYNFFINEIEVIE